MISHDMVQNHVNSFPRLHCSATFSRCLDNCCIQSLVRYTQFNTEYKLTVILYRAELYSFLQSIRTLISDWHVRLDWITEYTTMRHSLLLLPRVHNIQGKQRDRVSNCLYTLYKCTVSSNTSKLLYTHRSNLCVIMDDRTVNR